MKGALTGTPNYLVTHMLFADDLCLMSNDPNHMQTMLNKRRAYARRKFLTVNTQKSQVMCFNSYTSNLPPLFYDFMMGRSSPTQTPLNIWAWFVTDIST